MECGIVAGGGWEFLPSILWIEARRIGFATGDECALVADEEDAVVRERHALRHVARSLRSLAAIVPGERHRRPIAFGGEFVPEHRPERIRFRFEFARPGFDCQAMPRSSE